MSALTFNVWLNQINEQRAASNYTLRDIWRGYDTIRYKDYQTSSNSAIIQVQKLILNKLNSKSSTKQWVIDNKFKPDNDFGKTTIRALGLAITGKEYIHPETVSVGPKSLKLLGLKEPLSQSNKVNILATTLAIESGPQAKRNEILAIANVIINRQYAYKRYRHLNKSLTDIVLAHKQFSLWNGFSNNGNTDIQAAMKKWRPENRKNWKDSVEVAKKMINGSISDNTHGATHYYNPQIVKPYWAKKPTWQLHKISNVIHTFGRDTSLTWAKRPVPRT